MKTIPFPPDIRVVAILDDKREQAETTSDEVKDAGLEPLILELNYRSVDELVTDVRARAQAAICDHRLSIGSAVTFTGAEAVERLYQARIPAFLQTSYMMDADVTIREHRRGIPVLLSKRDVSAQTICDALNQSWREIQGDPAQTRRSERTLVRIDKVTKEDDVTVVDAVIPGWEPHEAVRFPVSLMGEQLGQSVAVGQRFFARVNIDATTANDLYFTDFELAAPQPPEALGD